MAWVKTISITIIVLCLFVGGILFDIFVVKHFSQSSVIQDSEKMTITQTLEAQKLVTPSWFRASPSIVASQKLRDMATLPENQRNSIMQSLNAVIKEIQANATICKGGEYSLGLNNYLRDNQIIQGYGVQLDMQCEFTQAQKDSYDTFLSKILAIANSNEFLEFSISPIRAFVPDNEQIKYQTQLRESILTQANELQKYYTDKLSLQCEIARLGFSGNPRIAFATMEDFDIMLRNRRNNDNDIALPIPKEQPINLHASLELQCQ